MHPIKTVHNLVEHNSASAGSCSNLLFLAADAGTGSRRHDHLRYWKQVAVRARRCKPLARSRP
eukprot:581883-Heterocapsa_arctica.AAC.1